nr:fatty acid amide hydrolase-like isoform X3 [Hydra vulgaris]
MCLATYIEEVARRKIYGDGCHNCFDFVRCKLNAACRLLQRISAPALPGWAANVYRKALRTVIGRRFLLAMAKSQADINIFMSISLPDNPTYFPIILPVEKILKEERENEKTKGRIIDCWKLLKPSSSNEFAFNTISDYIEAYRNGVTTPTDVAHKIIDAIVDSESRSPKMRIIIEYHTSNILSQAEDSTKRWKNNTPLSVFDGIPVAVKDEMYLAGYPCRSGMPLQEFSVVKSLQDEGWMVSKLREGGAIFIGMANMHQLGIGTTGINPSVYHGTCRNPYNVNHSASGSSSGPAAAVAAGLCPIALGADGGGSIRIPAGTNGIVGLKATFSRISGTGFRKVCSTVAHPGFVCSTVRDSAIAYGFLAGPDCQDPIGLVQPLPNLLNFEIKDLYDIKIGVDWTYFNHCNPEIATHCKQAVDYLVNRCNAKLVEISIPELYEAVRAHCISILTEMATNCKEIYNKYHDKLNTDSEINLQIGGSFTAIEYFEAQKQRTRCMNILQRLFSSVDCIVNPTFGDFMPKLNEDMLKHGYTNLVHLSNVTRFASLGNLTGHPSVSIPIGYSINHLPIGLMVQASWWREDLVYRVSHALEGYCKIRKPEVYYDVLAVHPSHHTK